MNLYASANDVEGLIVTSKGQEIFHLNSTEMIDVMKSNTKYNNNPNSQEEKSIYYFAYISIYFKGCSYDEFQFVMTDKSGASEQDNVRVGHYRDKGSGVLIKTTLSTS